MPRQYDVYLNDILLAIEKIQMYTKGLDEEGFSENTINLDAVLFNLVIIGEAVKHIPDDIRHQISEIEWRKIAGFRDIAIHQYFRVNPAMVWDILSNHLELLQNHIRVYLNNSNDE